MMLFIYINYAELNKILERENRIKLYMDCLKFKNRVELDLPCLEMISVTLMKNFSKNCN